MKFLSRNVEIRHFCRKNLNIRFRRKWFWVNSGSEKVRKVLTPCPQVPQCIAIYKKNFSIWKIFPKSYYSEPTIPGRILVINHVYRVWCLMEIIFADRCFMVCFMAESCPAQSGWAGWGRWAAHLVSLQTHKPRICGTELAGPGVVCVWWRREGRSGDAGPRELNNLKTKSCDVYELLVRAQPRLGRCCLNEKDCWI